MMRRAAVLAAALLGACSFPAGSADSRTTIRLWGLGREGEVVRQLVPDFERRHPELRLLVQQIPWS